MNRQIERINEIAIKHREISANQLIVMSISSLNNEQFNKVKPIVLDIARNFTPEQNRTVGKRY